MHWQFYGPDAVLLRFADALGEEAFQRSRSIAAELERQPPSGLIEFVPAFTTVLLEFDSDPTPAIAETMPELIERLQRAVDQPLPPGKLHRIPIVYDGEDLERVAKAHQLSTGEVCSVHAKPIYNVCFLGFAPGFPYLAPLDPRLHTERLPSPRPHVLAGSVAIGGQHTGIYPVETPAGWNIVGHTTVALFDPTAEESEMFLLRAGDRVQFVPENTRDA
jgi:KipI family sensor histidine kinase inhibitor